MDHDLRRKKLENLVPKVAEGMRLNRENRPAEAKEILREAWNEAKVWHCTSALIAWQLAVSFDLLGNPVAALRFIGEALRLDPFPAPFRASCEVIVGRARRKLAALEITNSGIREIVRGLVKVGAATPDDHLLLARYCYGHGLHDEALAEVDAALKLNPEYGPAQIARAVVLTGLGWRDEDTEDNAAVAFAQALGNSTVGEA